LRGDDQDSRALAYFLWDFLFLQMQLPMPLLYVCLLPELEPRADEIVGNVGKSEKTIDNSFNSFT
jgi:RNAse (barnase) inhibitor barstar